jgi:hypothetical protein
MAGFEWWGDGHIDPHEYPDAFPHVRVGETGESIFRDNDRRSFSVWSEGTSLYYCSTRNVDGEGNPAYWQGPEGKCYIELTDGSKVIFARMV